MAQPVEESLVTSLSDVNRTSDGSSDDEGTSAEVRRAAEAFNTGLTLATDGNPGSAHVGPSSTSRQRHNGVACNAIVSASALHNLCCAAR